jgi:Vacuolar sorting-associated protein 13, N-terminal
MHQALQKHSAYRPSASVLSDPKAWWHYVIAVTLRDVRERRGRWGLQGLTHRRHVSTYYTVLSIYNVCVEMFRHFQ